MQLLFYRLDFNFFNYKKLHDKMWFYYISCFTKNQQKRALLEKRGRAEWLRGPIPIKLMRGREQNFLASSFYNIKQHNTEFFY